MEMYKRQAFKTIDNKIVLEKKNKEKRLGLELASNPLKREEN